MADVCNVEKDDLQTCLANMNQQIQEQQKTITALMDVVRVSEDGNVELKTEQVKRDNYYYDKAPGLKITARHSQMVLKMSEDNPDSENGGSAGFNMIDGNDRFLGGIAYNKGKFSWNYDAFGGASFEDESIHIRTGDTNGGIVFGVGNNAENKDRIAMYVKSNGNVGIGTTTPEGPLHVKTTEKKNSFSDGIGFLKGTGGNDYQLQINAVGGVPHIDFSQTANEDYDMRLAVYTKNELVVQGGDLVVRDNIKAKNHTSTSDQRLKQNIEPLASSLSKLTQLRGVSFKWKDDPQDNQIGLVAQEVEKILPEIVSTDSKGYKSIAYGKLTAVLLEAIKELQSQVDELKQK